jgi:hypothetical protein
MSIRYNLEGVVFRSVSNTATDDVDSKTVFHYRQATDVLPGVFLQCFGIGLRAAAVSAFVER